MNFSRSSCLRAFFLLLFGAWAFVEVHAQTVSNPGFEEDLTDWEASFDYEMSGASAEAARTGKLGLRVVDASPTQGSGLESLPLEVDPGQTIETTFWARRVEGSGTLKVSLRFFDGSGKRLQKQPPSVTVKDTPFWTQFSLTGIAPEEAVAFGIRIESAPLEEGTFDLDDFLVRQAN